MSVTENSENEEIDQVIGDDSEGVDVPVSPEGDAESAQTESVPDSSEGNEGGDHSEADTPEKQIEKWKEIAARNQADLENYRKRMARERTEAIQYGNASLLTSLLPVIDNFDMGLKAAENEGTESMIYQGMSMVRKQLVDFLTENKVEEIEVPQGTVFDPNLHEALKQENSDEVEEGKVLYTMRKGYRLRDRLLRPANVVVSSGNAGSGEASE